MSLVLIQKTLFNLLFSGCSVEIKNMLVGGPNKMHTINCCACIQPGKTLATKNIRKFTKMCKNEIKAIV